MSCGEYKRKNSSLTFTDEATLVASMELGGRPASVRVALTKVESKRLLEAGEDELQHKRPEGGLKGECPRGT